MTNSRNHKPCDCKLTPKNIQRYEAIQKKLKTLLCQGESVHFKPGQVLFYAGHVPFGFFYLQSGEITPKAPDDNVLGLGHLLANSPHCATLTARNEVDVLFFPKAVLLDLENGKRTCSQKCSCN